MLAAWASTPRLVDGRFRRIAASMCVLEMIGGDVYQKSLQVLAPGGRLVSLGGAFGAVPDPPPSLSEGRKASRFSITNHLKAKPEDFHELSNLLNLVREKKIFK